MASGKTATVLGKPEKSFFHSAISKLCKDIGENIPPEGNDPQLRPTHSHDRFDHSFHKLCLYVRPSALFKIPQSKTKQISVRIVI